MYACIMYVVSKLIINQEEFSSHCSTAQVNLMYRKLLSAFHFLNISSVCFLVLSTDSMDADWRKRCKPASDKIKSPLHMMNI